VSNVATAADFNTYIRDNSNWLAQTCGVFGVAGSVSGNVTPAAGSAGFYIQAGSVSGTASSGNFNYAWPTAFPTGVLAVVGNVVDSGANTFSLTVFTASAAGVTWEVSLGGAGFSGSMEMNYIAIGF